MSCLGYLRVLTCPWHLAPYICNQYRRNKIVFIQDMIIIISSYQVQPWNVLTFHSNRRRLRVGTNNTSCKRRRLVVLSGRAALRITVPMASTGRRLLHTSNPYNSVMRSDCVKVAYIRSHMSCCTSVKILGVQGANLFIL